MDRIFITPLANKLASLNSINLENVKGSGPRGRITKVDIEKHLNENSNSTKTKQQDNLDQEFYHTCQKLLRLSHQLFHQLYPYRNNHYTL